MIDAGRAFDRIAAQTALGPRVVGTPAQAQMHALLRSWLAGADWLREQEFGDTFFGHDAVCRNFWAHFAGKKPGRVLFGTHFDTRPFADCDPEPARRHEPVLGANDGGSGTALLAELALELAVRRDRRSVDLVFFDAEDWHDVDGKQVSIGSRHFVHELCADERPDAVVIFDMVGGRDLQLDVDAHCQNFPNSLELTTQLFGIGRALDLPAFSLDKAQPYKWVICDHTPFMTAGIATALMIDLDYPVWHTTHDAADFCAADSLGQMAALIEACLFV